MPDGKLTEMLIRHEGLKLKPYICPAGKLTIGVGRNIEDNGISREEAILLLKNDLIRCGEELRGIFPGMTFDDVREAVILSMIFNLGRSRFLKFKATISAIRSRDWDKAADQMADSLWAKQVGNRAVELGRMMRSGRWE